MVKGVVPRGRDQGRGNIGARVAAASKPRPKVVQNKKPVGVHKGGFGPKSGQVSKLGRISLK